jgi:ankyrin repeat protein
VNGFTALHHCAIQNFMSCMELLCEEKGKDGIFAYGIKNRYNYLPIDICEENKNRELKEYLEKFS